MPSQCDYDVAVWRESPLTPWFWEVIQWMEDDDKTIASGLADSEEEARSDAAAALKRAWEVPA